MSSSSLPPLVRAYHKSRENELDSNAENGSYTYDTVTVEKEHYERLLRISQQFENLKQSLLGGGVSRENFEVLANESARSPSPAEIRASESLDNFFFPKFLGPRSPLAIFREGARASAASSSSSPDEKKPPVIDEGQRTIDIRNLPERTTHLDLTNAIRGGALLEIYLRYSDNSARVAFADAAAAYEFLDRAKRQGIRVGNKRIDVFWSDRQFFLRPYIKQNLSHGASRNLAIHNINPNITPALIREHLDHIHNLVVIDTRFDYEKCIAFISTNSVHNAMFARSCMKSRASYRGMKIEFVVDECSRPYEQEQPQQPPQQQTQSQRGPVTQRFKYVHNHHLPQHRQHGVSLAAGNSLLSNRFEMLSVDSASTEDGSDSDDSGSDTETED